MAWKEDGEWVEVANEEDLKEWTKMAGWESVEQFEKDMRIDRKELYGKPFSTIGSSLSFKEDAA